MKKLLAVAVLFTAFSFTSWDANAKRLPDPTQSCFSFYYDFFNEHYGGINLDNVGDFNHLVAQCETL